MITTEQGDCFLHELGWLQQAKRVILPQPAILMYQSDWNSGDRI